MLGFQLSEAMCAKGYRKPEFNLKGGIHISPLFRPTLSGGEGGSLGFFGVLWGSLRIDGNARCATKKRRGRGSREGSSKSPRFFLPSPAHRELTETLVVPQKSEEGGTEVPNSTKRHTARCELTKTLVVPQKNARGDGRLERSL